MFKGKKATKGKKPKGRKGRNMPKGKKAMKAQVGAQSTTQMNM